MRSRKRLFLLWDYYLHYHHARVASMVKEGARRGWDILPYSTSSSMQTRIHHIPHIGGEYPPPHYLSHNLADLDSPELCPLVIDALEREDPDAILIPGYGFPVSRTMLRWSSSRKRGSVVMFESKKSDHFRNPIKELAKRLILRKADCAFCGGSLHAAYARDLGFPQDRIFTGYSAIDNNHFSRLSDSLRQQPTIHPTPYILAIGRLIPKKGFESLVDGFAQFKAHHGANWHLVILGEGPQRPILDALIKARGLTSSVWLPGYADVRKIAHSFAHAAIFVLPSTCSEQWGLVVNEAMACKVPVVVSDACGCAYDLVKHGITGLQFHAGDSGQLGQALATLSNDKALSESLASEARRHIEGWSLERFANNCLDACEKALSLHASRFS